MKFIENSFIPVAIYNNVGGKDKKILKRFSEPSWNFQVIRFIDSKGKDIIPRKDRVWDLVGVKKRAELALKTHSAAQKK